MTTNNASILLFESDPLLCDLIQLSLEQEGFTVYVQRAAQNPLEIVKQIQPDIILLDLFYPQTQTIELIEKIHQLPNEPPIEIIVISALGFREVVQKALDAGAREYILKPLDISLLLLRVKKVNQLRMVQHKQEEQRFPKPAYQKPSFRRIR